MQAPPDQSRTPSWQDSAFPSHRSRLVPLDGNSCAAGVQISPCLGWRKGDADALYRLLPHSGTANCAIGNYFALILPGGVTDPDWTSGVYWSRRKRSFMGHANSLCTTMATA